MREDSRKFYHAIYNSRRNVMAIHGDLSGNYSAEVTRLLILLGELEVKCHQAAVCQSLR